QPRTRRHRPPPRRTQILAHQRPILLPTATPHHRSLPRHFRPLTLADSHSKGRIVAASTEDWERSVGGCGSCVGAGGAETDDFVGNVAAHVI
ncbi:hypothetical protein HK104_006539, partial [Borealophlyctis nickersoniae]